MILKFCSEDVFEGYIPALQALEESFQKDGFPITFCLYYSDLRGKMIGIRNTITMAIVKTVPIEGDSPAQAVKDAAETVNCCWGTKKRGRRKSGEA
jgi:hypothetical protein